MTKIEAAQLEYDQWCSSIGIDSLEKLNKAIDEDRGTGIVNLSEARQERKYVEIATMIRERRPGAKIIMMSGPSSSGKTSTALRIALQCKVLGMTPKVIELDNYFVNREDTPKDENGEYDYECLGAMDIELLNSNINDLLAGREVELPKFDFRTGRRGFNGDFINLGEKDILLMEGIHALNPALTPTIDRSSIYMVYISALSALPFTGGGHNSTTDKRLMRRIVRDSRVRNNSPEDTILRWDSVRRGELRNIFPYEENADAVFNSSTLYDLPLLKYYVEPLLFGIRESSPAYPKAQSLISFLSNIRSLSPKEIAAIPPTSIMREFIGGQSLVF